MTIEPADRPITETVKPPVAVEATPATRHRWTWGLVVVLLLLVIGVLLT